MSNTQQQQTGEDNAPRKQDSGSASVASDGASQRQRTVHTPGPWINNGGQIEVAGFVGATFGERVIATVGVVNEQTRINTANARLIAAAPELLAACNRLVARLEYVTRHTYHTTAINDALEQGHAVIAKAEGVAVSADQASTLPAQPNNRKETNLAAALGTDNNLSGEQNRDGVCRVGSEDSETCAGSWKACRKTSANPYRGETQASPAQNFPPVQEHNQYWLDKAGTCQGCGANVDQDEQYCGYCEAFLSEAQQ